MEDINNNRSRSKNANDSRYPSSKLNLQSGHLGQTASNPSVGTTKPEQLRPTVNSGKSNSSRQMPPHAEPKIERKNMSGDQRSSIPHPTSQGSLSTRSANVNRHLEQAIQRPSNTSPSQREPIPNGRAATLQSKDQLSVVPNV